MAISGNINDREYKKFVEDVNGNVAVRTLGSSGYTVKSALIAAAQDLTAAWADVGSAVDVRGYKDVVFWATIAINDSQDVRFKVIGLNEVAGTEEYPLSDAAVEVMTDNTYAAAAASRYFELNSDVNQLVAIRVKVNNSIAAVKLQTECGTVGTTAGQITAAYVTKGY